MANTKENWPFTKISGRNGDLFHMDEKPLFAKINNELVIAINDAIEFQSEDKEGNIFSQLGKVLNLFFLESTQMIVAQIECQSDKQIVATDVSRIQKNLDGNENVLLEY